MNIRIVENDVYLPVLRELITEGHSVRLTVRGQSMMPFLINVRDSVIIEPVTNGLKKGDIVIFKRKSGAYIMHRIWRADGYNKQYYLVGDAQKELEGPIDEQQIFGIVNKVCRKGKWIDRKSPVWWFYDKVWGLMRPFRTKFILAALSLRQKLKRTKYKLYE